MLSVVIALAKASSGPTRVITVPPDPNEPSSAPALVNRARQNEWNDWRSWIDAVTGNYNAIAGADLHRIAERVAEDQSEPWLQ